MDPIYVKLLIAAFSILGGTLVGGWVTWARQMRAGRIERSINLIDEYQTQTMAALRYKVWNRRDVLMNDGQNLQQVYESQKELTPLVDTKLFDDYVAIQAFFRKMAYTAEQKYLDRKLVTRVFATLFKEWWDELFQPFSAGMDADFHEQRARADLEWLLHWLHKDTRPELQ